MMTTERMDSARLARIDERTVKLDQNMTVHISDDNARFERMFKFVKESFDKIDGRFDKFEEKFEEKIDHLWDERNQRKGAISFGKLATGAFWAIVVLVASVALNGGLK